MDGGLRKHSGLSVPDFMFLDVRLSPVNFFLTYATRHGSTNFLTISITHIY